MCSIQTWSSRILTLMSLALLWPAVPESVLRRGWAIMELGRRASRGAILLQEVAEMIRAPENRRLITVATTSIPSSERQDSSLMAAKQRSPSPQS